MNTLIACATCANNFADAGDGSNPATWSIMFLLVVIVGMLGSVGFFMVRLARRGNESLDPELRDDGPSAAPTP